MNETNANKGMTMKTKLIAEICLYGNKEIGFGWLAQLATGARLGNGEPKLNRSQTECVWLACDHIQRLYSMAGAPAPRKATVRVFLSGGMLMADIDLRHPGYVGQMSWVPATQYEIPVEQLLAASTPAV